MQLGPDESSKFDQELIEIVARGSERVKQSFQAIERHTQEIHRVYYAQTARIAHSETSRRMGATLTEVLQAEIGRFQVLTGKRVAEHSVDLIRSLNSRRLYSAALTTRAIIEVAASLVYFDSSIIPPLVKGIRSQQGLDDILGLIDKHLRAGRFDWERWSRGGQERADLVNLYADYSKPDPLPRIPQTSVLTMIKRLDARLAQRQQDNKGMIRLIYALLTDICHPAIGAHMLLLVNRPSEDWYLVDSRPSDDLVRWYCLNTTIPLVERLHEITKDSFRRLRYVAETLGTRTE